MLFLLGYVLLVAHQGKTAKPDDKVIWNKRKNDLKTTWDWFDWFCSVVHPMHEIPIGCSHSNIF